MGTLFGKLPDVVSLDDQLDAVLREISMRRRVYARMVQEGRKTRAASDRDVAVMEAVLATLRKAKADGR